MKGGSQKLPPATVNSVYVLKSAMDIGFNDDGTQVMTVLVRIGGRAEELNALLKRCGWEAVIHDDHWKLMTYSVPGNQFS